MTDWMRGHVEFLLLSALEREPAHGYRLAESLREGSDGLFDLPEGTVYPCLYRLERKRLVTSRWEASHGRRRRVYRLTKRGTEELQGHRSLWRTFVRAMEAVGA